VEFIRRNLERKWTTKGEHFAGDRNQRFVVLCTYRKNGRHG
jgi:hypothetical protein